MTRPLEDVRIIAVEQYGAGPWGSVHLADLGADVIKIEDPRTNGDVGRYVPPFQEGEDSLFFEALNRNKRSLSLDLTTDAGREVFERLVACSDAVYSNLRGDVPGRLELTYDDLKDVNPAIVCCSLSAFGMTGPRASEPGYDYVMQGLTGWMSLTGEPGGPPQKTGLSLVDFAGGYVAALALMAGLHAARRDGVGMDCDVSLYETALSMLNYQATWHLTSGHIPTRTRHSAHPSLVPFQNFETADGWIVVACPKDKFFRRLLSVLKLGHLVDDARFTDFETRRTNKDAILEILEAALQQRRTSEILLELAAAGVPCAPVNDVPEAVRDAQIDARQGIIETEHPRFGTVRSIATPVRVGAAQSTHKRAPRRGENAAEILHDLLQYDAADVLNLSKSGAFGAPAEQMA
ncbi:CoA transferase [Rhodococcus sp. USK10]|uniref:CAIB/BAIF family protein n=1 Tax=Rhodococcus wratislaviensis TaxID=44752 RepID=A0A402CEU9_RHOWR|nr:MULTISPECIES: CoA transferase [Rhodococcus]QYB07090.1 CoA transferase [Rhodococcus sp. USK10]GCE42151.1 CAIB/BAIF family protein [Rhodococcus wratislaviensis]